MSGTIPSTPDLLAVSGEFSLFRTPRAAALLSLLMHMAQESGGQPPLAATISASAARLSGPRRHA